MQQAILTLSLAGITNAMDAGKIAGEVCIKAKQKVDYSARTLKEYEDDGAPRSERIWQRSLQVKNLLIKLTDEQLNPLAHSLDGIDASTLELSKLLVVLFKKNPKILWETENAVLVLSVFDANSTAHSPPRQPRAFLPLSPTRLWKAHPATSLFFRFGSIYKSTGVATSNAGLIPRSTIPHTVSAAEGAFPITIIAPSSSFSSAMKPAAVRVAPVLSAISLP
jgi:hypothetical protein